MRKWKRPLSWRWVPVLNIFGYPCLICDGEDIQAASSVNECLLKTELTCVMDETQLKHCNSNSTNQDPLMSPPVQECHCNVPLYGTRQVHWLASASMASGVPAERQPSPQRSWTGTQKWTVYHGFGVDPRFKRFKRDYSKHIWSTGRWDTRCHRMVFPSLGSAPELSFLSSQSSSLLLDFSVQIFPLTSLQGFSPLLSSSFPHASCRYFSIFSCLFSSSLNRSATFAGWLLLVSHSDAFLLSLSSELQMHIFPHIFLLGPGFSWLYLGFAGL